MSVSQTLSVTEVSGSVNTTANTSKVRILWTSTQTGDSHNDYTRTAKYYISINGGAETEYSVSYTLPQNSTKTIVDTTITVNHRNDGTGTVSVRTWMDTSISAGVVKKSETLNLTTIPRASTITSANPVTLGSRCKIVWTPASASFYYKVEFSLDSWRFTTEAFRPGITTAYTYTGYPIPYEVARNFPDDTGGIMTATLYTYSDSSASTQIGDASSKSFKVTLPDIESTKPSFTMALKADNSLPAPFSSMYIQGLTRAVATFTDEGGEYGAEIVSYSLSALGTTDSASPYLSGYLTTAGTVTVVGKATDSRGYSRTAEQKIKVIPYSKPKILPASDESEIICARCDSNGNLSKSGTYLKIKARRSYEKVTASDVQNNFCAIRYRYREESATNFSSWKTILSKSDTSTNTIDSDAISGVLSSAKTSYVVQVGVIDDVGYSAAVTFVIPTDFITIDIPEKKKGKRIGIGRYAEDSDEPGIDIAMDLYFDEGTTIHGAFADTVIETGLYTHEVNGTVVEGSWRYKKWESGTYDLSGTFDVMPITADTIGAAMVYYSEQIQLKLPFPIETIQYTGSPAEQYCLLVNAALVSKGDAETNGTIGFRLMRFIDFSTEAVTVRLVARGRWK